MLAVPADGCERQKATIHGLESCSIGVQLPSHESVVLISDWLFAAEVSSAWIVGLSVVYTG